MRRLRVEYLPSAQADLRRTIDFLRDKGASQRTATNFVRRIRTWCDKIGDAPHVGTARYDLAPGLRTVGFERRSTVSFVVLADRVQIVNVFYGGRDIEGFYERQRVDGSSG